MSFETFITTRPTLKYIFFGGKGGVGKTAVAAGAAYHFAEHLGKKTLIYSMNPLHSLSTTFCQEFLGKGISKVYGAKNLYAMEMDISDAVHEYRQNVRQHVLDYVRLTGTPFLPELFSDVDRSINQFVDTLTTNPAFEESLMFNGMIDLALTAGFDTYVIDTAPVAFTIRLLKASRAYDHWLNMIIKQREEIQSRGSTVLRGKPSKREQVLNEMKKDPLILGLLATRERTEEGRRLLKDKEKTAFFFVTLPRVLSIMVVEKFIGWMQDLNIPVGGIIVNEVIPREQFDLDDLSPYVLNQVREQDRCLEVIHDKFQGLIRVNIPQYNTDVRGVSMVARVAEALSQGEK